MFSTLFTGLERRTFQRLELPIEVTVDIIPGRNTSERLPLSPVRSSNISQTGICLETKSMGVSGINLLTGPPHARENRLLMQIDIIPQEPPFCALGEVRWYDVLHGSAAGIYLMGVEFIEIKDNGKVQLARFLKLRKHASGFVEKIS